MTMDKENLSNENMSWKREAQEMAQAEEDAGKEQLQTYVNSSLAVAHHGRYCRDYERSAGCHH